MQNVEARRAHLRHLIADAPDSNEALRAAFAGVLDEIDRAYRRIGELETALARLAGTVPLGDDLEVGRSDETIA